MRVMNALYLQSILFWYSSRETLIRFGHDRTRVEIYCVGYFEDAPYYDLRLHRLRVLIFDEDGVGGGIVTLNKYR